AMGGMEDHVHMLFHLPPSRSLADAMRLIKTNSSRWINDQGKGFAWQEGYGAFAVSASMLGKVVRYIHNQEMHHRKISFEEEYLGLLKLLPTAHAVGYNIPPLPGILPRKGQAASSNLPICRER